jgi:uncharacterized DUF497 family protein
MHIEFIVCPPDIEDKLAWKHHLTVNEARQVLVNRPRIRFAEKGHLPGDDVYGAFGQTFTGRYVVVYFIYKPTNKTAVIISGRDMTPNERRSYGRK